MVKSTLAFHKIMGCFQKAVLIYIQVGVVQACIQTFQKPVQLKQLKEVV